MKTIKIETQIKKIMLAFVQENGLIKIDITINGIEYSVLAPTRWHYGQITITHPEHGTWIADYTKSGNLGIPKHCIQLETGGWVPVSHPLVQK